MGKNFDRGAEKMITGVVEQLENNGYGLIAVSKDDQSEACSYVHFGLTQVRDEQGEKIPDEIRDGKTIIGRQVSVVSADVGDGILVAKAVLLQAEAKKHLFGIF